MNRSSFDPDTLGTSGSECDRYVDLLPVLDSEFLSVEERAAVRRHLASCAACRTRLAAFAPMDAALHRYVEWLTVEATQPAAWLAVDDIMRLAHEHTGHSPGPADPPHYAAPRPHPSRPNRFFSGLAALAAVLLIALSATIFVLFGYGHLAPPGQVTPPAVCAPNQISAHLPKDARLLDLAMISADEGWLVGYTPDTGPYGVATMKPLLLHYRHCEWTQVPLTLPGVSLGRISAVSANDVWVFGAKESFQQTSQGGETELLTSLALHYTGGQWQVIPFPVTTSPNQTIQTFTMISSIEGWLVVAQRNPISWGPPYQDYHGVNGVWSLVSAPGYQNLLPIAPFAPGATDAPGTTWLTAEDSATSRTTLLLYHNGNLTPMYTLPVHAQSAFFGHYQMHMDSPQSAWIGLQMLSARGAQIGWLLLHCSLSSCRQSSLVNDPRIQLADTVQVFSASEGWAFRSTNQQGASAGHIENVFRLHNGQWQSVPWPFQYIQRVSVIVQIGPDEYWALADSSLLHFANGAWSSYS